jgi:uncharacterized protein (TIGR02147 family)
MIHQEKFISLLIKCDNYRSFLLDAFHHMKSVKRGYSLTLLARKIGCKSKSYPNDVMNGRRSLSAGYAPGFASAFGLKGDSRKLFLKLVELEKTTDKEELIKEIDHLKYRLKNQRDLKNKKPTELFESGDWIDVYASLGSLEKGSSLAEIQKRTGLTASVILKTLKHMQDKSIIKYDSQTDRYYAGNLHYFFEDVSYDSFFQKRIMDLLQRAESTASNYATGTLPKKDFFHCSTFSILEKDIPQIKTELRDVLNKFAQDAEFSDGDKLAHVIAGLLF